MIPHHMMAIMMSQQLLMHGQAQHPEVAAFARKVRDDQWAEVRTMRQYLTQWFGQQNMPSKKKKSIPGMTPGLAKTGNTWPADAHGALTDGHLIQRHPAPAGSPTTAYRRERRPGAPAVMGAYLVPRRAGRATSAQLPVTVASHTTSPPSRRATLPLVTATRAGALYGPEKEALGVLAIEIELLQSATA